MLIGIGVLLVMIVAAVGVGVGYVSSIKVPPLRDLRQLRGGASSIVYASDGTRLGAINADTLSTPIRSFQIPVLMKRAVIAIEDQRFYQHGAVDFAGILRAAVTDLTSGKPLQGGSTIAMQLARNLYIANEGRTFRRKIEEAKIAQELERAHSKDWILTDYLNSVPYGTVGGQTAIGVSAAARIFFNESAQSLTLSQAALLAGLPQAPSLYNPFIDPAAARTRRNEVLAKMAQLHYVSQAEALQAEAAPLGVRSGGLSYYSAHKESFFFQYVKQLLINRYGTNTIEKGGLRIYTTIDLRLQQAARSAISGILGAPGDPASAIVSIDPRDGYIRAMAESPQYEGSQFNLASQSHRQPGSTFKTMVLLTALREGVDPNSTYYTSRPLDFVDPQWGPIKVRTYSNTYTGSESIVQATLQSDNTIYEQLDLDVGPTRVKQTAIDAGVTSPLQGFPAEGLGGLRIGVSPLEMANAYATIADGGFRNSPIAITRIVFPSGQVDDFSHPKRVKVFSDGVTAEATDILHQNVLGGTGTAANYGCPAAGKTGTVDNFTDAWFDGFTPHMSTSVWVGYPKAKIPMTDVHGIAVAGGTFPAQIWHDYMQVAMRGDCTDFTPPKQPIVYTPFSGRYESGSGPSLGPQAPTNSNGNGKKNGGNVPPGAVGHNPKAYVPQAKGPPPGHAPPAGTGPPGPGGNGGTAAPTH